MTVYRATVAVLVTSMLLESVSLSRIFPNHRYYGLNVKEKENQDTKKYKERLHQDLFGLGALSSKTHRLWQRLEDQPRYYKSLQNKTDNKTSPNYVSNQGISKKQSLEPFENFVTTKENILPRKGYEVTTEKIEETFPSALGVDNDVTIAIDESDEDLQEDEDESEERHRDFNPKRVMGHPVTHVWCLVREQLKKLYLGIEGEGHVHRKLYVDSYGQLHHTSGYNREQYGHGSYGYGVLHNRPNQQHNKPIGRVKMQVFRGPTRSVGRHKYAQWGYYVVQPSDYQTHYHQNY